jgi:hypothetical protein
MILFFFTPGLVDLSCDAAEPSTAFRARRHPARELDPSVLPALIGS